MLREWIANRFLSILKRIEWDLVMWSIVMILKTIWFYHQTGYDLQLSMIIVTAAAIAGCNMVVKFGLTDKVWGGLFLSLGLSIILLANEIHHQALQGPFSISILKQASYLGEIKESVMTYLHPSQLLYLMDIPLMGILMYMQKSSGIAKQAQRAQKMNKMQIMRSVLVLWGGVLIIPTLQVDGLTHLLKIRYSNTYILQKIGLPHYVVYDLLFYARQQFNGTTISDEQKQEMVRYFEQRRQREMKLGMNPYSSAFQNINVIMLQVESLEQFMINGRIEGQEITPNLNALSAKGLYFDSIYDQTASGRTTDAEIAALRSVYPSRMNGSIYVHFPQNVYYALPKVLKTKGYFTNSAHAFDASFYNRNYAHANLGFDQSLFETNFRMMDKIGWGLSDASFYRQMTERYLSMQQPFFSFLITLSNHTPFQQVLDQRRQLHFSEPLNRSKMGQYLQSVHYTDWAIGQLVKQLRDNRLMKKTLLVIYGDHDAGFTDEEFQVYEEYSENKHASPAQRERIPLIFYTEVDGVDFAGQRNSVLGGQLDIAPTVMDVLGIKDPAFHPFGSSLMQQTEERVIVFRDGTIRERSGRNQCDKETVECTQAKNRLLYSDLILETNMEDWE